jgi:hypothetical protein
MSTTQAPKKTAAAQAQAQAPGAAPRDQQPAVAPPGPEMALGAAVRGRGTLGASGMLALQRAAGNRAVVGLVQAKAAPLSTEGAQVHEAAKVGIGGTSGALPHLEKIQRSFGRHDVTGVVAQTGAQATAGAQAMGAAAFTMGNHVAFAGSADLQTAAHEAAHVVQQRAGVQLAGGVGQEGDRHERHADAVAGLVLQGKSAESLLDAHTGSEHAHGGGTQRQVQRILVGRGKTRQEIKSIDELAPLLGLQAAAVVLRFNAALGTFPAATNVTLNAFLNKKKTRVSENIRTPDAFLTKLANSYKSSYMERTDTDFTKNLKTIKQDQRYTDLINPQGINYADGVDDGAAVNDAYNIALACSLFALLKLKPNFLGAASPRDLHHIFRSNPKTRNYDNDREVAQIRLSAGLQYRVPGEDQNTVGTFMASLTQADRGRKFIIDPSGQAHTFALVYSGGRWKKFDNDHQAGVVPGNEGIRVIWE